MKGQGSVRSSAASSIVAIAASLVLSCVLFAAGFADRGSG